MEREIITFKHYFKEFFDGLSLKAQRKVIYVLSLLRVQRKLSAKFVKPIEDGLFELRVKFESNIYRIFFCFDDGNIVILFNGFQKKSQKTPKSEIEMALKLKKQYYEQKGK